MRREDSRSQTESGSPGREHREEWQCQLEMGGEAEDDAGDPNEKEDDGEPKGEHGAALGEGAIVLADNRGEVEKDGSSAGGGSGLVELIRHFLDEEKGHGGGDQDGEKKEERCGRQGNGSRVGANPTLKLSHK